jgi:diaminopimelate epimerase
MISTGRAFYKMSGSGNDFVMVDARTEPPGSLAEPSTVQRVCARATGIGADGIVFLEPSTAAAVKLNYLNADGSPADLCGNATLCTTRLAVELGFVDAAGFGIETPSGIIQARLVGNRPAIDLQPVVDVRASTDGIEPQAGERRVGYATVGVPHIVIRCDDVSTVDVVGRGRRLRHHPTMANGANVNFVSRNGAGRWRMRTYERGVEAETLACGSGSVATAILLATWAETATPAAEGEVPVPTELEMTSGRILSVGLRRRADAWMPTLSGEARVVFQGSIAEL